MSEPERHRRGLMFGVAAYGMWGLLPLYFKAVAHVPPTEVLAHRIVWSFFLLAGIVTLLGRWGKLGLALRDRRAALALGATTVLIAVNWLTYIYAVSTNQVLQSSLGYFATPLANVMLGVLVLKERLRAAQVVAILLAALGVVNLGLLAGSLPWIAVTLAVSFALYGLLRKLIELDGLSCLLVETLLLFPLAAIYLVAIAATSGGAFGADASMSTLLAFSALATAVPLLLFAAAAKRLRLSTLGILQYLAPTLQFLLAVLAFREPFSGAQLLSFALIWLAVGIYSVDSLRAYRQQRNDGTAPVSAVADVT